MLNKGEGYTVKLDRVICGADSGTAGGGDKPAAFEQKYCDEQLWEKMVARGWEVDSQAFETGPPVRVRVQPAARKYE